jgi:hypothetical protein
MAFVRLHMDGIGPEQDANLVGVAELLRRERPVLTFDELERVDRRLNAFRAPPRTPRRGSRLAVVICLVVGLLFMTAGTGLAIGGFATPVAGQHAPYPDRAVGRRHPSAGGKASRQDRGGTAASPRRAPSRHSTPSRLSETPSAVSPTSTVEISLSHGETRSGVPFTGFGAIPILAAGIVLIVAGTAVNRRTRGSWRPV